MASSPIECDKGYQKFLDECNDMRLGLESLQFDTIEELLIECAPGTIPEHLQGAIVQST